MSEDEKSEGDEKIKEKNKLAQMASRSSRAQGHFFASISPETRSPKSRQALPRAASSRKRGQRSSQRRKRADNDGDDGLKTQPIKSRSLVPFFSLVRLIPRSTTLQPLNIVDALCSSSFQLPARGEEQRERRKNDSEEKREKGKRKKKGCRWRRQHEAFSFSLLQLSLSPPPFFNKLDARRA